jgi:hypothetical protein
LFLHGIFLILNWHDIVFPEEAPFYSPGGPDYGAPFTLGPARFQLIGLFVPAGGMPLLFLIFSAHHIAKIKKYLSLTVLILLFFTATWLLFRFFYAPTAQLKLLNVLVGLPYPFFIFLSYIITSFGLSIHFLFRPRFAGDRVFGITNLAAIIFSIYAPLLSLYLYVD